jgi:hypothetical protein
MSLSELEQIKAGQLKEQDQMVSLPCPSLGILLKAGSALKLLKILRSLSREGNYFQPILGIKEPLV